ncbi:urease accessory protein D-like [Pecten maximus]|uniref:urease accessory protein D-like n=1 Tax=Pecten maximus TaxID=6579 RepID=UPI001458B8D6|nr:urease accessory protein D-like [Pecten maximus]
MLVTDDNKNKESKSVAMILARQPQEPTAKVVLQEQGRRKGEEFGLSEAVTIKYTYPMKILVPEHVGNGTCRWIFPITFGGGLVGGDKVSMEIDIQDGCCGLLTSQEATKVYHCEDGKQTSQSFVYTVGEEALLCVLPDYVVCYKDAAYTQIQEIQLCSTANVVFLDWMTAGRVARNEEWEFNRYLNRTEIKVDGKLIFKDQVVMQDSPYLTIHQSMKDYQVIGTCVLLGSKLQDICVNLQKTLCPKKKFGEKYNTDTVCSASPITDKYGISGLYIRFMTRTTTAAYAVISDIVQPLLPILGADPFHNKY